MAEQATSQQTEQNNWLTTGRIRRLKWSSDMISDLLECKKRAQELASSEEPARNTNGRKKGYMKILKELWDDLGYARLNLTCQNLRDQAARMEKTMGNVRDTITRNAGNRSEKQRARESEELIMQEFRNEFIVSLCKQSICRDTTQHSKYSFFELLKSYQLIEVIPPWYSPTQPKPSYENEQATVYWDVPVYADHIDCLLYTSPSPRDQRGSRMPSSA